MGTFFLTTFASALAATKPACKAVPIIKDRTRDVLQKERRAEKTREHWVRLGFNSVHTVKGYSLKLNGLPVKEAGRQVVSF